MVIGVRRRAIGVFSHRRDAEKALHELRDAGFAMDRVSVLVRHADRSDRIAGAKVTKRIGNKAEEGTTIGVLSGGALGGLTGLLVGLGSLAIPGVGPIMLAGATATALATTIAGAGIGAVTGGLLGALIGLGIPEERAKAYTQRIQQGHYLVIINGTDAEIAKAEAILRHHSIEDFAVYDISDGRHRVTVPVSRDSGVSKHGIGYFFNQQDAEAAINDLRSAGFPLSQISLIHKDVSRPDRFPSVTLRDRFDDIRLRLPDARSRFYNERINQGDYVVIVNGTDAELHHATPILNKHKIQQWEIVEPIATAKRAVGVFSHPRDVEAALLELRNSSFPMNQVSVIGKVVNSSDAIAANTKADQGAKAGVATGGRLGSLGGLLVGSGVLEIPRIGPVMAAGNVATSLATAMTGSAIGVGAGGFTGGLVGLGISEHRARIYSDRFNKGDYLVFVDGTDKKIRHAEAILKRQGIQELDVFDAADLNLVHYEAPITDTTDTNYLPNLQQQEPKVIIIDRRKEKL